jgi:hypothetical protein
MKERRRCPRYPVQWHVVVQVQDGLRIRVGAFDACRHGVRLAIEPNVARELLRSDVRYRVEVQLPKREARFTREAQVRHSGRYGVGLEVFEAIPNCVFEDGADRAVATSAAPVPA